MGWGAFAVGSTGMFLLMANSDRAPHGVLLGIFATLTAVLGLMAGLGFFARE